MTDDIFRHADASLEILFRGIGREFQFLSTEIGFDELNILETRKRVNEMYQRLDSMVRREYRRICQRAYLDGCRDCGHPADDFDTFGFVVTMLRAYDPLSEFVYTREWTRKRDRLFESIIATERGNQEMRRNLKRGLDVLSNQVRQYADEITIKARLEAFKRSGIQYVRWIAEKDDKTCETCWDRDKVIYPMDQFPMLPAHWHCRCHCMPATEDEYKEQQRTKFEN